MDRSELADFLRRRREQLTPAEVGLPPGVRRRTPGLRRDEVALLAGMSTDYYTRLEQARGPRPSVQVLDALARALRFSSDERDHLYHLVGHGVTARSRASRHVGPGIMHVLAKLDDTAATVISDLGEVLVQNRMHTLLVGDHGNRRGWERYYAYRWFTDPGSKAIFPEEDWDRLGRKHVADLRATAARRAGDPDVTEYIKVLRSVSSEFDELWNEHEVAVRISDEKRILHPEVGLIDTICESLLTPNADQRVLVYLPRPGTDAAEKLNLLRVIGTQTLAAVDQGWASK
ncbi:helix-turn-helix transcriptional regulator [Nocardia arthritidis]|uniref:Helix-turn-helix domain-containing protein n=1 Tax=Nocardia arthritidis TaxID=228602 RepID=A0A6G9YSA8_9NOCA|nr:helix-turn-helix transcriptional regulator [Nocardia arthritidis]QIS15987.1 helix-turn-helix domain-containing protein [Nocardia arthritidis]